MGEMADFAAESQTGDESLYEWTPKFCRHCGMLFEWGTLRGKRVPIEMDYGLSGTGGMRREHLPHCRVVGTSDLASARRRKARDREMRERV